MKLREKDKDIGFSIYEDGKPLSVTVGTGRIPDPLEGIAASNYQRDRKKETKEEREQRDRKKETKEEREQREYREKVEREQREYREKVDAWHMESPEPLELRVTIGLGLDRVTATLPEEEAQALTSALSAAAIDVDRRNLEIKEWRERRPKKDGK